MSVNELRHSPNDILLSKAAAGDKNAQNLLVEQNTGLVHSVVKRFAGRGYDAEDLFQIGCIGLIKAVQKFDLQFGVRFSTYAVPLILGEIKRFLRDDGIIKVSRSLKETAFRAGTLRETLTKTTGREPTLGELADALGISAAELSVALEATCPTESLQGTWDSGTEETTPLLDRIEGNATTESELVNRLTLRRLLEELEGRDRTILFLRYYKEKTQTEIAARLGISQVQVSRIEKRILAEMRKKME